MTLKRIRITAETLSHLKTTASTNASPWQQKPQTIFEVLQDICEKNDLRFGQAISSIFGNDLCLFYKTNEELMEFINEKKIKLNLK